MDIKVIKPKLILSVIFLVLFFIKIGDYVKFIKKMYIPNYTLIYG